MKEMKQDFTMFFEPTKYEMYCKLSERMDAIASTGEATGYDMEVPMELTIEKSPVDEINTALEKLDVEIPNLVYYLKDAKMIKDGETLKLDVKAVIPYYAFDYVSFNKIAFDISRSEFYFTPLTSYVKFGKLRGYLERELNPYLTATSARLDVEEKDICFQFNKAGVFVDYNYDKDTVNLYPGITDKDLKEVMDYIVGYMLEDDENLEITYTVNNGLIHCNIKP